MREGKSQSSQMLKVVLNRSVKRVLKINYPNTYFTLAAYQILVLPL